YSLLFFVTATRALELSPLSLHDALPILRGAEERLAHRCERRDVRRPYLARAAPEAAVGGEEVGGDLHGRRHGLDLATAREVPAPDRKSTRLNSSHVKTSYAVFCVKKKRR